MSLEKTGFLLAEEDDILVSFTIEVVKERVIKPALQIF